MNNFAEKIAARFGAEELFRAHGHHIPRIASVVIVGGVGLIFQTTIFETLGVWWGILSPSTAAVLGAECAIISNFSLNERFSFRDAVDRSIPLYRRLLKFHLVSSGSLVTQWICVLIAESISQSFLVLNLAFIIGVGIGFVINYTGYYFFVWKRG